MATSKKGVGKMERKDKLISLDDMKGGHFGASNSAFTTESNMMDSERLMCVLICIREWQSIY